ncbi:hypothetical protein SNEBB_011136 [Seison nebaliae]|nr:hypothetical protein SNEBB_011136 [Seison nebaliae]
MKNIEKQELLDRLAFWDYRDGEKAVTELSEKSNLCLEELHVNENQNKKVTEVDDYETKKQKLLKVEKWKKELKDLEEKRNESSFDELNELKKIMKVFKYFLNQHEICVEEVEKMKMTLSLICEHTNDLYNSCEHLMDEQKKLIINYNLIDSKLKYFVAANYIEKLIDGINGQILFNKKNRLHIFTSPAVWSLLSMKENELKNFVEQLRIQFDNEFNIIQIILVFDILLRFFPNQINIKSSKRFNDSMKSSLITILEMIKVQLFSYLDTSKEIIKNNMKSLNSSYNTNEMNNDIIPTDAHLFIYSKFSNSSKSIKNLIQMLLRLTETTSPNCLNHQHRNEEVRRYEMPLETKKIIYEYVDECQIFYCMCRKEILDLFVEKRISFIRNRNNVDNSTGLNNELCNIFRSTINIFIKFYQDESEIFREFFGELNYVSDHHVLISSVNHQTNQSWSSYLWLTIDMFNLYKDRLFQYLLANPSDDGNEEMMIRMRIIDTNLLIYYSTAFYEILREKMIQLIHLELVTEIFDICVICLNNLKDLDEIDQKRIDHFIYQLIRDLQERLIFRADIYIQTEIENYQWSSSDIDYPNKLMMIEQIQNNISHQSSEPSAVDMHGLWYPTLRRSLICLSKLYRCLSKSVFEQIGEDVIESCMRSLVNASKDIEHNGQYPKKELNEKEIEENLEKSQNGEIATNRINGDLETKFCEKSFRLIHSRLFLIKHLLILREQLEPFSSVSFRKEEIRFDFQHMKSMVTKYVKNESLSGYWELSRQNSLLKLVWDSATDYSYRIEEMNSKNNLDQLIKESCFDLIDLFSEQLFGNIEKFIKLCERFIENKSNCLRKSDFGQSAHILSTVIRPTLNNYPLIIEEIKRILHLYFSSNNAPIQHFLIPEKNEVIEILMKMVINRNEKCWNRLREIVRKEYLEQDIQIIKIPSTEEMFLYFSDDYHQQQLREEY